MSIEFRFYNKPLSRKELLEQTDLRIETYPSSNGNGTYDCIKDKNGGGLVIVDAQGDDIYELATGRDWYYIMDTIVSKFNILFYTDNLLDSYYHFQKLGHEKFPHRDMITEDNKFNWDLGVIEDMELFRGYEVIDLKNGIVKIPNRYLFKTSSFSVGFFLP